MVTLWSGKIVTKWCREFSERRTDVHDEERCCRPSLIFYDLLQEIEGEIRAYRRVTIRELHHIIPEVSKTTIHEAVTENLRYRKLCAHWVPKLIKITKRNGWVSLWSFSRATQGRRWVSGLHCDWRWNMGFTPNSESKQQSLQWRHTHSPRTKKFKTSISVKKIMASVFWDRKGILLVDFMPPGATINAAA